MFPFLLCSSLTTLKSAVLYLGSIQCNGYKLNRRAWDINPNPWKEKKEPEREYNSDWWICQEREVDVREDRAQAT